MQLKRTYAINKFDYLCFRVAQVDSIYRGICPTGDREERESGIFCECQDDEDMICGWDLDVDACSITGSPRRGMN